MKLHLNGTVRRGGQNIEFRTAEFKNPPSPLKKKGEFQVASLRSVFIYKKPEIAFTVRRMPCAKCLFATYRKHFQSFFFDQIGRCGRGLG